MNHAKNARQGYGVAQDNENTTLQDYLTKINESVGTGTGGNNSENKIWLVDEEGNDAQNKVLSTTSNTNVYDEYGNKIVVPAGFKITTDANHVTEGIVIEDKVARNQFVWIPVGKIYTNIEKTESKTITLGRYNFDSTTGKESVYSGSCTEDTKDNHDSDYKNATAKDIAGFIDSANTKKGYYLGRYEAGKLNNKLVCNANQTVYTNVTQPEASSLSQSMYASNNNFTSDLVNSYAWDTAIVFIQTFGTNASSYATKNYSKSEVVVTGGTDDEYCNINEMSGNAGEFCTETGDEMGPCVQRGGYYDNGQEEEFDFTCERHGFGHTEKYQYSSFRPILYVN